MLAMLRMLRMMGAVVLGVVLGGVLMMFVSDHRVAVCQVRVMGSCMMITGLMMLVRFCVVMSGRCMMMRGVEKQNSLMTTSCMLGRFRRDERTRGEFLHLLR